MSYSKSRIQQLKQLGSADQGCRNLFAFCLLAGCAGFDGGVDETELLERSEALTASTTNKVAIHVSETTASNWKYDSWKHWQISEFVKVALSSDGTQFEVLSDAQIANGSLFSGNNARYPLLISLANEAVSDAVIDQIRTFVNNGGHAYIGSSSFTRRENGTDRGNFALAGEMGLVSRGSWQLTNHVKRVVASTPLADLLPTEPQWHFLPLRWNVSLLPSDFVSDLRTDFRVDPPNVSMYGSRPLHEGSHWFWDAVPLSSIQTGVLVRPWVQFGFDQQVTPASSSAPAGFAESILATGWNPQYDLQVGDVNGDRKADLVGRNTSNGDLQVALSTGQGFAVSSSWGSFGLNYQLWLADVDRDGDSDLIGRPTSGGTDVQIALSQGKQGTLAFAPATLGGTWSQSYVLLLADVNGDGAADIVGRPKSGGVDVQVGLSRASSIDPGFNTSEHWTDWNQSYDMALADVDGDGDADLVGRLKTGSDVQVALSQGKQASHTFLGSSHWTDWDQSYELRLGDGDGDGKADLIGHHLPAGEATPLHDDVLVATSLTNGFAPSQRWGYWEQTPNPPPLCTNGNGVPAPTCPPPGQRQYVPFLGDVNGDGRIDLLGRGILAPVNVALWLNKGPVTGIDTASPKRPGYGVMLFQKNYGAGKFIYNANLQALAGYGGDSRIGSEYQSLRSSIDTAYQARDEALVRVSPWPYPYRAAFIYRHDHVLNTAIVEKETACGIRGEYYIQSDTKAPANTATDYPTYVHWATQEFGNQAIIGAHQKYHRWSDESTYTDALEKLNTTRSEITLATGGTPTNYVAPGYLALLKSSFNAIVDAGFLTAGEQGFSPFPAFTVDPEVAGASVGSLLQLPVTGVLDQVSQGGPTWPEICKSVDTVYAQNGLLNVYDHGGQDIAGGDGHLLEGAKSARKYLHYVFGPGGDGSLDCQMQLQAGGPSECSPPPEPHVDLWTTTSSDIRKWWLLRERKSVSVTQTRTSTGATINVTIATAPQRPNTTTDADPNYMALRIRLSDLLLGFANANRTITLTGAANPGQSVLQGDQLVVNVKNATAAQIVLGN